MLLLVFFFPALLVILTIPLWFFRKISNETIQIVASLLFCAPGVALFFTQVDRAGGAQDFFSKIFLIAGMLLCSGLIMVLYVKLLHTKRCPHCHEFTLKLISKTKDVYTSTKTRIRRYEGIKGQFAKSWETVTTFTYYDMWCPKCLEHSQYQTKDVENLESQERHLK